MTSHALPRPPTPFHDLPRPSTTSHDLPSQVLLIEMHEESLPSDHVLLDEASWGDE